MNAQPETAPPKESKPTLSNCYVREAKIYDEGMVTRWKVLMDGLLLFAALFSAVVTAFIIEGYKNLSPDPSAVTVVLLFQISQQLSTITNTTELNILLPDLNRSPTLAIITNIFWFLSLALSLTCALTATLIEQWASDYVRTIERRDSPEIKARIRAYLFEGVENSNVAAIVEGTPLLLHASLFSFFIGLIFFLHPISNIMTFFAAGILTVFGIAYLSATIAPLIDTASPIRTPLTTLVLQFSFARNFLRKTSLCEIKVASFMGSRARAGTLACWKPVTKYSSVVAQIGRALTKRLSNWARQIGLIFSRKAEPAIMEMQPSSEIPEQSAITAVKQWFEPFAEIWSDNTLSTSDLESIKESTALDDSLPEFYKREIDSLFWTLQHTTNDDELLLFLEGIPIYLRSQWSDLHFGKRGASNKNLDHHSPVHVLRAVLPDPESTFLLKLDTFTSTRTRSMTERDASAVVNALSSLFENHVHLYTEATRFLHPDSSSDNLHWFMGRVIELYPSLSSAVRHLQVIAVLRCAQARDSKYKTIYDDLHCWPYSNVDVPVGSFQYSELRPFWEAIGSVLGFEWREDGMETVQTAANRAIATGTDQVATLLGLCVFFWEDIHDPRDHFTASVYFVMEDLVSYVSPLAEGSAKAQQAYSAAVLLITSALEDASPEIKRRGFYGSTVRGASGFLGPLLRITDDAAAATAQRVLCCPLWSTRLPDNIPSSWLKNPALDQIYCANWLRGYLRGLIPWPWITENVATLAGMHSTIQIEFTWSLNRRLARISSDDPQHIPSLLRLLGTLDEPEAVIEVQQALREFLTLPHLERNLDAVQEALGQLETTASKPEFIYKTLSSVLDYP
ncbi:hypothetical protein C8J56DRAFT_1047858 [Mycena floridula]|nr:hypothetical protein C8J56DRAFT_1047858 [Mycena floridula]